VVIGTGCNLWGTILFSDHVPAFSWGEANSLEPYQMDNFIQTAKLVKQRRKLDVSEAEVTLFNTIWQKEQ